MEPYFIFGFKSDSTETSQFQSSVDDDFLLLLDRLSFGFEDEDLRSFWRLEELTESVRLLEDFLILLLLGVEDEEPILVADEAPPLVEDDDDSSSFTDAPLSPPQATRAMASKRTIMDPIEATPLQDDKSNSLILYSFIPTQQTKYIIVKQQHKQSY
jgi:hypothetical protein